jgi:hypothetical protein
MLQIKEDIHRQQKGTRDERGSYSPEEIGNEEEPDAEEEIGADEPT